MTEKNIVIVNQDGAMGTSEHNLIIALRATSGPPKSLTKLEGGFEMWKLRFPHLCEGIEHSETTNIDTNQGNAESGEIRHK